MLLLIDTPTPAKGGRQVEVGGMAIIVVVLDGDVVLVVDGACTAGDGEDDVAGGNGGTGGDLAQSPRHFSSMGTRMRTSADEYYT